MRGMGRDGAVAARELVLALRSRLDPLIAVSDGEFDRLVIADLEMQERALLERAPVAAIDRVGAQKIDRAGDMAPVAPRHHQQDAVGHRRADPVEKIAGEIGAAPFARAGVHVEGEERTPMCGLDVGAGQKVDLDVVAQRLAPLALDCLALARGERGEESVEIGIALVEEMKLLAGALGEASLRQRRRVGGIGEGDMDRGGFGRLAQAAQRRDQRVAGAGWRVARDQQPPPGDRREGHRDLQLGVIAVRPRAHRPAPRRGRRHIRPCCATSDRTAPPRPAAPRRPRRAHARGAQPVRPPTDFDCSSAIKEGV